MKSPPLDESLGFLIYRTHTLGVSVLRKMLQAEGLDVTPEQLSVMGRIWEQEGANQNRLAEKAFKDRHTTTRILSLLQKKGFIERKPDEGDSRAYRLFLTRAGRDVLAKAAPVVMRHWKKRQEGLSRDDIAALRRILGRIADNLEDQLSKLC